MTSVKGINRERIKEINQKVERCVRQFDTDHSGQMTKHELGFVLRELTSLQNAMEPSEQDIQDLLKNMDADGDGKVKLAHFLDLLNKVLEEINQS